jgi:hypothetical protein
VWGCLCCTDKDIGKEVNMEYTVTWTGMDRIQYEDDFTGLADAQERAVMISEHGGYTIIITDGSGVEYPFRFFGSFTQTGESDMEIDLSKRLCRKK